MKTPLLALSFLFFATSFSQNLEEKISQHAISVFGINGEQLLKKISIEELNASSLYERMMRKHYRGGDLELINSLSDFGIDYQKAIFYVEEEGAEEVDFKYLCYHIKDMTVFEDAVKNKMVYKDIEKKGGLNVINYNYYNKLYWNDAYALLILGRYTGHKYDYSNWFGDEESAVEEVEIYVEEPIDTITAEDLENMTDEEWMAYLDAQEKEQQEKEEEKKRREEEKEKRRQERIEMKERTVSNAIFNRAQSFFSDDLKNNTTNLQPNFNAEADAYVYFSGRMSLMEMFMGISPRKRYGYPFNSFTDFTNNFNGDFTANFLLNETTVNIDADFEYPDALKDEYSKIFKSKMNKKFIRFISDDDLAYMSYTVNSEELWNAYPKMIEQSYGLLDDEENEEEWSLIADLISLVIDEEALSSAFTGDAVFILNGLSVKDVTYSSWEYDEEYNYNSVEKTKEELVPDFTVLFGSEEDELIKKIFRVAVKNKVLRPVEGGFQSDMGGFNRNSDFFFGYQKDILVMTSTHEKLKEFNAGGSNNKLSGDKAKQIKKNTSAMFINAKEIFSKLMYFEGLKGDNLEMVNAMKADMTNINMVMYYSKDIMKMEASAEVPSQYKNGAVYLLHLIDNGINAVK